MTPTITAIKAEILDEEGGPQKSPIPRDQVLSWMKSEDLEVLGATHTLLHKNKQLGTVESPLGFAEFYEFMTRYYERCLRESIGWLDASTALESWESWQEADFGFDLNHNIVYWFMELRGDKSTPRQVLLDLKEWLASMLISSGESGPHLAKAVFDHLLVKQENQEIFCGLERPT